MALKDSDLFAVYRESDTTAYHLKASNLQLKLPDGDATNQLLVWSGTAWEASNEIDGSVTFADDISIGGTLPSAPNISLNSDGSATFVGLIRSANATSSSPGNTVITKNYINGFNALDKTLGYWTRATALSGRTQLRPVNGDDIIIRDATNTDTKIELNANGTARFAGNVVSGGEPGSGANDGVKLGSNGFISVSRTNSSDTVFNAYVTGSNTKNIELFANGTATFAGPLEAESIDGGTF